MSIVNSTQLARHAKLMPAMFDVNEKLKSE